MKVPVYDEDMSVWAYECIRINNRHVIYPLFSLLTLISYIPHDYKASIYLPHIIFCVCVCVCVSVSYYTAYLMSHYGSSGKNGASPRHLPMSLQLWNLVVCTLYTR